jgi:hypothetical protein
MLSYFGEWDAPMTDNLLYVDAPIGEECIWCNELIQEGQAGGTYASGQVTHKECSLRTVMGGIGHLVDHGRYCHSDDGPDAGLNKYVSAKMVWAWVTEGARYTVEDIEALK